MALFTSIQADACTIKKCISFLSDGVHLSWGFEVEDAEGYTYSWVDNVTAGNATDPQLKTAMKDYLTTTVEKKPLAVPVKTQSENLTIKDTTIGGA